ncbi:LrgB family protein [Pseudoalteromonas denitrificans]|uniref:TIGR00659 family protein n=1 Tax=Pseudoalteromonas denitrificans DSM 6059 TaxID=1123010 RepID=A0A1I1HE22_9GAMM|nr:LrgB family protein [Pseudoalteromonas denitrificans]SFC22194.1 TIGR00659 family protein [Pseudoalteromonas denitrificans DSM 6059]
MIIYGLPLTIILFFIFKNIQNKTGWLVLNPILMTMLLIIFILIISNTQYSVYAKSNLPLTFLLEPAIVALAMPLYKEFIYIKPQLKNIVIACAFGVFSSTTIALVIAYLLNADEQILASVAPNAVTSPIAMALASSLGGIAALAATIVILIGVLGAIFAHPLLKLIGVSDKAAQGLAMGAACHALGTARAVEINSTIGAFASVSLIISTVLTSLILPILYPLLMNILKAI